MSVKPSGVDGVGTEGFLSVQDLARPKALVANTIYSLRKCRSIGRTRHFLADLGIVDQLSSEAD